jgi:hypothetical protein
VHGGNAVEAILYLVLIANNIMQLFLVRRLKGRYKTLREIVRLLLKGLYLLKHKAELVFNSRSKVQKWGGAFYKAYLPRVSENRKFDCCANTIKNIH